MVPFASEARKALCWGALPPLPVAHQTPLPTLGKAEPRVAGELSAGLSIGPSFLSLHEARLLPQEQLVLMTNDRGPKTWM